MILSKKPCFILIFTCNFIVLSNAQKAVNPFVAFKNANWLKDADIAVAKNTETYTFGVENTEGVSRVSATLNVDEWLFPAKQNQTFYNRIFVNDEVMVEDFEMSEALVSDHKALILQFTL